MNLLILIWFEHCPLDQFALMGYTGAVFRKFLGTSLGMTIAYATLLTWIIVPVFAFLWLAKRKDF